MSVSLIPIRFMGGNERARQSSTKKNYHGTRESGEKYGRKSQEQHPFRTTTQLRMGATGVLTPRKGDFLQCVVHHLHAKSGDAPNEHRGETHV